MHMHIGPHDQQSMLPSSTGPFPVVVPSVHINRHKPWRAPPQTLISTLRLQPSRPFASRKSVLCRVARGKESEEKSLPDLFHEERDRIPRMSFPTGRVCASLARVECMSLDPSSALCLAILFTRSFVVTKFTARLLCDFLLLCLGFWQRCLQSSFDVVRLRVFLRWVVST